MFMESISFFLSLFIFLLLLAYLALHTLLHKNKPQTTTSRNAQDTPIPPGRTGWPLIGESFDYISNIRNGALEKFVRDRRNKYSSKVFKTSLMGQPVAILCGAEGNKFLFSNKKKLVQVWFPRSIDKIFPKPENFIQVRKMLPSLLKPHALRKYIGVIDTVIKHQLQTNWDQNEVKVGLMVRKYTLALACRLFLSMDDPEEVEKLGKPIQDIDDGITAVPLNLPGTALNRAIKASKILRLEIEGIAKQRKIDLSDKIVFPVQDILSDMLLATDENGQFFRETEISSHISGLLLGGYSTINAALTFVMKYLAELPDVYVKVLGEQMKIKSSKDTKELLTWEDLRKMKYSWNVANEVMRVMPPGLGGFREATTDFIYAGYTIPKGWKLHWMTSATGKSAEYFPNPEKFDPSRFEGNGPAPYTFVPFGGGPRMCPGNEYARLAILVFMHNVVTNFRWEKLIPDERVLIDPIPRLSHGLPICLFPH